MEAHEGDRSKAYQRRFSLEAGSLDGSDEDGGPVEVTFELGNTYRRKSSLVSSEVSPLRHRPAPGRQKAECIVHQLLEEQKSKDQASASSVNGSGSGSGSGSSSGFVSSALRAHPSYMHGGAGRRLGEPIASRVSQLESLVEQKDQSPDPDTEQSNGHPHHPGLMLEMDSSDSGTGQPDQRAWTEEMAKSISERDLLSLQQQQQQQSSPPRQQQQQQQQQQPSQPPDNLLNSRMLTKKQLSEMAWGVRELSRRLSSMRIKSHAKSIFVLTKIHDSDLIQKTRDVAEWLLSHERGVRYSVYVQRLLKTNKKFDAPWLIEDLARGYAQAGSVSEDEARDDVQKRLRYWDEDMCRYRPHNFDLIITLGGDGTVLYASWLFQRIVPPVLSFSLGSLGFLTKFDFDNFQPILRSAFEKGVTVSLRLRFECTIMRSVRKKISVASGISPTRDEDEAHRKRDLVEELIGEESEDVRTHSPDGTYEILNEVVVDRGPNPTMSYIELFGDDEHFTSVSADGICVSTPTGSTAYNLAAGGSLCHPENPVMLVTSICAHTLSFRPIILPDTIVLRVGVPYDSRTDSWASFDGRERVEMRPGDYVTISASRYPFASVQADGRRSEDWVNGIRSKLGWNTRQKQKGYKEWDKA
ncbi:NAD(+) kinase [Escovopsis weberi]|uniref:NAD(+) kinase n=1 Tax=Escovopsis weberi TaxID=150374 RepID=A0A0N0RTD2_ESCWE|nr:NAD(+) kinase [Escovopsis weberi]